MSLPTVIPNNILTIWYYLCLSNKYEDNCDQWDKCHKSVDSELNGQSNKAQYLETSTNYAMIKLALLLFIKLSEEQWLFGVVR